MRLLLSLALVAACQALVMPTGPAAASLSVPALSPSRTSAPTMTSINKKAKAAVRKAKTARAVAKRFKPTATGKLLRHKAFRAHILTKKRPQRKQSLRRVSAVDETQLKTMQKLMLVTPKRP